MALKILMMGGRRCGKTSVLASMFNQMTNTPEINKLLTVSDKTILETKGNEQGIVERQEKLSNKRLELQDFLNKPITGEFIVDKNPTNYFWLYKLQVTLPGTKKTMTMEYWDSAGEFFDYGGKHSEEVLSYLKACDVYIIVVDTPYLMEGTEAVNGAANVVDSLHSFMTSEEFMNGEVKQVLFVPVKCERWIQEGRIEEVNEKIKSTYRATFNHLLSIANIEVSIIPIQTAGDILFSRLRDPYILTKKNGTNQKCAKLTERIVLLPNETEEYELEEEDKIRRDPEGIFSFDGQPLDIVRPVSWFHQPINREAKYSPKNCEQVTLHILRFMLNKSIAKKKSMGKWMTIFMKWFGVIFGTITLSDLQHTVTELTNHGLIKENVDGIERLKIYNP